MAHLNNRSITLALALAFGTAPAISGGTHEHIAKFGGIVIPAKHMDFEIVAKPEVLQIYLSDHGKPAKVDGGKAKITLLNGSEKTEAELLPAGDKLEVKGSFKVAKGTKGIALVTMGGKTSTVRFEIK